MAQLPNKAQAFIQPPKIQAYLLDIEHTQGGSKARYFMAFGFELTAWEVLRDALLEHAQQGEIIETRRKLHGVSYTLLAPLTTPDGRNPIVQSVWQIGEGKTAPRFITAFPDHTK